MMLEKIPVDNQSIRIGVNQWQKMPKMMEGPSFKKLTLQY